ncbi:hypothetical protein HBB16_18535 [Pseudonocardia sp. MCCB 268]|nr:hypothetical protein [Pseudonocardia cytotoxica]
MLFFSYTPEAWRKMIDSRGPRAAAAQTMRWKPVGGTLESLYFMFGRPTGWRSATSRTPKTAALQRSPVLRAAGVPQRPHPRVDRTRNGALGLGKAG